ncbi:hypothetical protein L2E82_30280 [Cichorium intybus]|uniref:Uncharacterized protein n=1 Tax=Cichorium intybus TaxID=13427 RepID=A0ACB9CZT0_CICIN|nr:hypothetical protein L2E82_30280 [Cichorium intybus]
MQISTGMITGNGRLLGMEDADGAINEDEDHAIEGPSDAEDSNATALGGAMGGISLGLVADVNEDGDVNEQESGNER